VAAPGDIPDPLARHGAHRHPVVDVEGWQVFAVDEVTSTNAVLAAHAAELPEHTVLVARHQTAGRGRLDRRWEAPPGANLLVSLLFHDVDDDPHRAARAVAVAAVAACRTVGVTARLKWPNDLVVGDAKLAGLLAERTPGGAVVVGLGLNVGWAPEGAARLGDAASVADVLRTLLVAIGEVGADVAGQVRAVSATIGREVRVELPTGVLEGRALDVDDDGLLVVVDACGLTHRVHAGDVVHLRPWCRPPAEPHG
jgi:BirA family biotin operon repressor/biotin-[acetyl-CoA-carboxylase] ligase